VDENLACYLEIELYNGRGEVVVLVTNERK